MREMSEFDLMIVGGGSAGFAGAIAASELGAKVALINSGTIGGTCVNVGCVPSKALIRAAEAHHLSSHSRFEGITHSSKVTDFAAVMAQKTALVEELRQAKYVDVIAGYQNVTRFDQQATFTSANEVLVGGKKIRAPKVLVTTGASAFVPEISGLKDTGYLTSTTAFELSKLPQSMVVLGGRYIALECAQMFARFGVKVTLLQRSSRILPDEDADLTDNLTTSLRQEGIDIVTNVEIQNVSRVEHGARVAFAVNGESRQVEAEYVLAALGRRANTAGFGLKKAGVELDSQGAIVVNERLESSASGVFAAGDVIGEHSFVYTAAYEGNLAVKNALSSSAVERDYAALPWVVFTDPQVAGVGMNEREAKAAGIDVDVATLDMSHVPRALAARDTRGMVKLLRQRGTDRLVGMRIVAPEGGEQVMEAALSIGHQIPVSAIASAFHPYLTQGESMKLCAQMFDKDVSQLSCCAV